MPYAVEENLRGMTERKKERKNDKVLGFLLLDRIPLPGQEIYNKE